MKLILIFHKLNYLLSKRKQDLNNILTSMFKKIREKTYEEINTFFREKILRITNINGSMRQGPEKTAIGLLEKEDENGG